MQKTIKSSALIWSRYALPLVTALALTSCIHRATAPTEVTERVPSNSNAEISESKEVSDSRLMADDEKAAFEAEMKALVETDLIDHREDEQARVGSTGIVALNEKTLNRIENYIPRLTKKFRDARLEGFGKIDMPTANAVLQSAKVHPIVSDFFHKFYNSQADKKHTDIGFCFGRATYMDTMLHQLGTHKDAIRKIWIVGNLKIWIFHVATMVYTEKGWVVLDPHAIGDRPLAPREWFSQFKLLNILSEGKKARVYITDANKFGALDGDYNQVQMGIKKWKNNVRVSTERHEDWYQHYFKDLLKFDSKKSNKLRLGLTRLVPSPKDPKMGTLNQAELSRVKNPFVKDDQVTAYQEASREVQEYILKEYEKKNQQHYQY